MHRFRSYLVSRGMHISACIGGADARGVACVYIRASGFRWHQNSLHQQGLEPSSVQVFQGGLCEVLDLGNNLARYPKIRLQTRLHRQHPPQQGYARNHLQRIEHDDAGAQQVDEAYDEVV